MFNVEVASSVRIRLTSWLFRKITQLLITVEVYPLLIPERVIPENVRFFTCWPRCVLLILLEKIVWSSEGHNVLLTTLWYKLPVCINGQSTFGELVCQMWKAMKSTAFPTTSVLVFNSYGDRDPQFMLLAYRWGGFPPCKLPLYKFNHVHLR